MPFYENSTCIQSAKYVATFNGANYSKGMGSNGGFKIEVATLCMQHAAVYIVLASQDARLPTLSLLYIRDEDS
jgi:hypothetical protein